VPGDRRLVGYVVPTAVSDPPAPGELRAHLARYLPDYMVPAAFVPLDALPVSPNGKLDRPALPAPRPEATGTGDHVAPRSDTERAVADIWADVLGVQRVGVHDDFFDLGGDSIRSLLVASRTAAAFDVALTPREVLVARTPATLAELVEDKVLRELERLASGAGNSDNLQRSN